MTGFSQYRWAGADVARVLITGAAAGLGLNAARNLIGLGHATQVWPAVNGQGAGSGGYWFRQRRRKPHRAVEDEAFQSELLETLEQYTGFALPD
ncbi:hypothetical protein [Pseudarthrobacter sp. NamB4]|uniref:hypothetical protein n=1 Tax=Pseudarthrobacter sp. NamB4 TaxID=2576837 RepID=UPI0010FECDEE|nr:hypothetical protein [Pseudarthrobacter sp. NamB4]TLM71296.1 hypothetical protein FDW81_16110 [Pseudarthrobacter sp. NamB4]